MAGLPGRKAAAYTGRFQGNVFLVRHEPLDGGDELLLHFQAEGETLRLSVEAVQNQVEHVREMVLNLTGTRQP